MKQKKEEGEEEGQGRTTQIIFFCFVSLGYQKPLRFFCFFLCDGCFKLKKIHLLLKTKAVDLERI